MPQKSVDNVRKVGRRSRFHFGRRLSGSGTPSAVLVDATGAIASPVVAGASAVFELIGLARSDQPVPR